MIKLKLEPVPYRYHETVFVYWEYELEDLLTLCFFPFPSLSTYLIESVGKGTGSSAEINLVCEDKRIKIWLPVNRFSDDLFKRIDEILKENIRILIEEVMF
ncbi:MAG TPA: hypothetical protein PLK24_04245 [Atribacter sp.]|jgi:hypothetical protein|uniref:Uncharacterized protein n=1 Tax=Candidatus Atribacter allofermentans TaxID=1852833 RepID=A0A1V5SKN5_9BACT|nr:hypothetical protein [Atribacter sp.]MDD3715061.1 hypothetical protein [Atribacterota bacterium]OQA54793.1 MAG: hypothetical protein BWY41_01895 [Candidatus Atribacteria bacterium ADurb.Bin276]HHT10597.1 hypothetical protein [Candidatus Atribacteria bacterium]MDI9595424.1 hypothetical protein [Atribacterota bacterium]HQK83134.1 hypothetical protein [Atribacter sp.]